MFDGHESLRKNSQAEAERFATKNADRPGMTRHAKRIANLAAHDEAAQAYKKEIGPEWTKS